MTCCDCRRTRKFQPVDIIHEHIDAYLAGKFMTGQKVWGNGDICLISPKQILDDFCVEVTNPNIDNVVKLAKEVKSRLLLPTKDGKFDVSDVELVRSYLATLSDISINEIGLGSIMHQEFIAYVEHMLVTILPRVKNFSTFVRVDMSIPKNYTGSRGDVESALTYLGAKIPTIRVTACGKDEVLIAAHPDFLNLATLSMIRDWSVSPFSLHYVRD